MAKVLPFKTWIMEEAVRMHRSPAAIYARVARGHYPWLVLDRVNMRVVWVDVDASSDWLGEGALSDPLNDKVV